MRGAFGLRLSSANNTSNAAKQTLAPFSTSSPFGGGGGSGRGRGRGGPIGSSSTSDQVDFSARVIGKPTSKESKPDSSDLSSPSDPHGSVVGHGRGLGRGKPLPSPSSEKVNPIQSFISGLKSSSSERARVARDPNEVPDSVTRRADAAIGSDSDTKHRFFIKRDESFTASGKGESEDAFRSISSVLGINVGSGRGKPIKTQEASGTQENRHVQRPPAQRFPVQQPQSFVAESEGEKVPQMSREDAVKHALKTLSKNRGDGGRGREGLRSREGPGAGRGGRAKFRPEKFEKGQRVRKYEEEEEDEYSAGLHLGDPADGERLAQKLGPEKMNQLTEIYEEIGERVLPSPMYDAFLDAYDVNCAIEFEPEYLMEFDTNPDIDEKPPIPLRDALEKMKPFLMAYEGIESHEEWEEIMKETMERVPLLKEIVDHYSGPDRVTAKRQHEELERVAKTLPESAPSSVKRFADRAVLSLQSNPGWGFHRKCQFMDKLVWEVSQHYK